MKAQGPLRPICITSHPLVKVFGVFFLAGSPIMLFAAVKATCFSDFALLLLMFLLDLALGLLFFVGPRLRQIWVLPEGVTFLRKRGNIKTARLWESYRFMYSLTGYKVTYFLFSPIALTKDQQYDAYSKCACSKDVPFVHGEFMILPANMYPTEIKERIPPHIRIVPEYECGTIWNKGKGL